MEREREREREREKERRVAVSTRLYLIRALRNVATEAPPSSLFSVTVTELIRKKEEKREEEVPTTDFKGQFRPPLFIWEKLTLNKKNPNFENTQEILVFN